MKRLLVLVALLVLGCEPDGRSNARPTSELTDRLQRFCGSSWDDNEAFINDLLDVLTLEDKVAMMAGVSVLPSQGLWATPGAEAYNVPGFRMVDGPRGVHKGTGKATAFPVGMARGATWDPELERRVGEAIAREARARGANVLLAPTINILRHPRWGRAQETYGEDPWHIGEMAVGFVQGVQAQKVVASAKHYAVNSIENTRFDVDVQIDERALREIYLPHFRRVVEDGQVGSVMTAYNSVNGAFASENTHLVQDILKGEWGFVGFVESDWIFGTHNTVAAIEAGLDIEMPFAQIYGDALLDAVASGDVDEARIDDALRRIVRVQRCFDLHTNPPVRDPGALETPEHLALAREVAERSLVLLRNETNTLPLDPSRLTRVALAGPLADVENLGDEGSSDVESTHVVTVREGLQEALGSTVELISIASPPTPEDLVQIETADVTLIVTGFSSENEGEGLVAEGDRARMGLSEEQILEIQQIAERSTATVVVLEGGSAVTMDGWLDSVEAVLMAWYPGLEGGHAIASVVLGEISPSGRLPIAFPVGEEDLPVFDNVSLEVTYDAYHGYRHLHREGIAPLFPMGFGLSTTTFEYRDMRTSLDRMGVGDVLSIEVDVANTGSRAAIETVQLYVAAESSRVERPVRELKGWAQAELEPGEAKTVVIELPASRLAFFDEASGTWTVEPITYRLEVGPHSEGIALTRRVEVAEAAP